MKKKSFVFFVFLLFFFQLNFASNPYFKNYSVEDGLPYIQINALLRDSQGFLWTGGYGGLSRFNGKVFQNFSPAQGLVNYTVTTIAEGRNNEIYVGTVKGISIYKEGTFKNITQKNGLINSYINQIKIAEDGTLIAATRGGIFIKEKEKSYILNRNNGLSCDTVLCISKINNEIWIAGTERGICLFSIKNKKVKSAFFNEQENSVSELFFRAEDKSLFFIVNTFLYQARLNVNSNNLIDTKRIEVNEKVNSFTIANDSTLWVATDNGLFKVLKKSIQQFIPGNSYNSSLISCIIIDDENIIWLGTYEGLFKYKSNGFLAYDAKDGISNNFVFNVIEDREGNLIATTGGGGFFVKNKEEKFKQYNTNNGLVDDFVWCAGIDKENAIWLGTNKGLCIFKNKKLSIPPIPELKGQIIFSLFIDDDNTFWFGGRGVVWRYKISGEIKKFILKQENGDCDISCIYKDKNGAIWMGAYQGSLYKFSGDSYVDIAKKLKLDSESFLSLAEDAYGNLYIGSFDGIYVFKNNKIIDKITVKDGLSSNLVYSLLPDKKEGLWIGTNQGLSYFDLNLYHQTNNKAIKKFGKADGFMGGECNTGGLFLDGSNNLFVGTVNGLIRFNPDLYRSNNFFPKTHITGLSVFYRDTLLIKNLKLEHNQNNIKFTFIGLSFSNPEKILYSYKLKGFDKLWSPPSPENTAKYSNLSPGKYQLLVKSCNDEKIWTPKPVEYSFEILNPFWKTWWFILAVFLFLIILIYFFIRHRISKIKEIERNNLNTQIEKANNELKALRAQMNPHFIFNSLNSIQHFVINHEEKSAVKYLGKFSKLIRKILNNSEEAFISLQEELSTLELYLELEKLRFQNKFSYEINIESSIETDFIKIPSMIIQPYIENSILHGFGELSSGGVLKIEFSLKDGLLVCIVDDNGVGINYSKQLKKNNNLHISLSGKISQDRLQLLKNIYGNSIGVEIIDKSVLLEKGTRVKLTMPIE
jgi:ligand-binding sensor domain-containing protein